MKISTRGRYALRFLLDLAQHEEETGFLSLQDVAERQGISKKYLEQIIPLLNQAKMLRTSRGNQGGYRLAKAPSSYTVGEILRVTEGNLACVSCVLPEEAEFCPRAESCPTKFIWDGLYETVTAYLDGITLQDVLDRGGISKQKEK